MWSTRDIPLWLMTSLAVRILLSVHSRTVRDNLADRPPLNLYTAARLALPLLNSAQPLADRPRSFGGPSAVYFCGWELLCRASGEQVPWTADCPPLTRGPSALLKIWQVWILPIFSIPTLILDHCSYKNPKISNIAWKPSKDSYEQVTIRIQK